MSLISSSFFALLLITMVFYYSSANLWEGKLQKYILLITSVFFYLKVSTNNPHKILFMLIYIIAVTYIGGVLIEKYDGWRRTSVFIATIIGLIGILFVTKYAYNMLSLVGDILHTASDFSILKFGSIIGISYFILSAIGYLADVYMEIARSEKNIVIVALFVIFFPQVVSGPITRFKQMSPQFQKKHSLDYDVVTHALRRMAWGYFKKLVISERFAIVASAVYADYTSYSGIGIMCATFCYAIQIYTDFSGCMDIVLGASGLFGIVLPENFRAPYMSLSYQEFYQRWHMTLGLWFKDYVMYPLQKSDLLQVIGERCKRIFGKKRGKKVAFYIAMLILWLGIGIWHGGTALYFMVSTIIPFTSLVLGDMLHPSFLAINEFLHINVNADSWKWFQRLRTLSITCILFLFMCAGSISRGIDVMRFSLSHFISYGSLDAALGGMKIGITDAVIMVIGATILLISDILIDSRSSIFDVMDRQNLFAREFIVALELTIIAVYGMVGQSQFIYFQF